MARSIVFAVMAHHLPSMTPQHSNWVRTGLFVLGCTLVAVSPAVGVIPGPGGLFVFAAGVALMLKTSLWAKRQFVHVHRRWPKIGNALNRGLRRPSARRRRAIADGDTMPAD
jgi:hypothetical protein